MVYRIAIAGLGRSSRRIHLPAYKMVSGLQLVGACDPIVSTERFPFPTFTSASEMLERTKPDILCVASPPQTHFHLVELGLRAGCHVICEKPFMETLDEADAIIALSNQMGRRVVVNNQFRFMRIHRLAKEKIGTPEFGNLLFLSMHQTFVVTAETEAGWRGQEMQRTGKDFGTHAIDLCRYFFGENPISIYARMPKPYLQAGPDYLNLIQLEFSRDRAAHILLDRLSRGRHRYLDTRLDGELGCIETSIGGRLQACIGIRSTRWPFLSLDLAMGGRARLYKGEHYRLLGTEPHNVFAHATAELMTALLQALEQGERPPCDAADNRHTLALMLAAYQSDISRAPIVMASEEVRQEHPGRPH